MKIYANLLILFAVVVTAACHHANPHPDGPPILQINSYPEIGQKLTISESSTYRYMVSSAATKPAYRVYWEGVEYIVTARTSEPKIGFIQVSDPDFQTVEGYQVGSSVKVIIQETGAKLKELPGMACYVTLSSGWNAALSFADHGWVECSDQLSAFPEVAWFFKRATARPNQSLESDGNDSGAVR